MFMKEAVEEERWWKKEGEGGIRRGIKGLKRRDFFLQIILGERIFAEEGRKEGARTKGKKTGGGG